MRIFENRFIVAAIVLGFAYLSGYGELYAIMFLVVVMSFKVLLRIFNTFYMHLLLMSKLTRENCTVTEIERVLSHDKLFIKLLGLESSVMSLLISLRFYSLILCGYFMFKFFFGG